MQEYTNFLLQHWELSLTFALILLYWLFSEYIELRSGHGVTPSQLVHLLNRESGVVVDLRDTKLYEESHILGALSFPEKNILNELNRLKKYQSKPVILVDSNGAASSKLLNKLIAKGFAQTRYLKKGLQSWNQAKLPLEKGGKNRS